MKYRNAFFSICRLNTRLKVFSVSKRDLHYLLLLQDQGLYFHSGTNLVKTFFGKTRKYLRYPMSLQLCNASSSHFLNESHASEGHFFMAFFADSTKRRTFIETFVQQVVTQNTSLYVAKYSLVMSCETKKVEKVCLTMNTFFSVFSHVFSS